MGQTPSTPAAQIPPTPTQTLRVVFQDKVVMTEVFRLCLPGRYFHPYEPDIPTDLILMEVTRNGLLVLLHPDTNKPITDEKVPLMCLFIYLRHECDSIHRLSFEMALRPLTYRSSLVHAEEHALALAREVIEGLQDWTWGRWRVVNTATSVGVAHEDRVFPLVDLQLEGYDGSSHALFSLQDGQTRFLFSATESPHPDKGHVAYSIKAAPGVDPKEGIVSTIPEYSRKRILEPDETSELDQDLDVFTSRQEGDRTVKTLTREEQTIRFLSPTGNYIFKLVMTNVYLRPRGYVKSSPIDLYLYPDGMVSLPVASPKFFSMSCMMESSMQTCHEREAFSRLMGLHHQDDADMQAFMQGA